MKNVVSRALMRCKEVAMNTLVFAAVAASTLVNVVVWIIVVGVIAGLLFWLIDYAGMPAPFNKVAKIILMIVCVLCLINALLMLVGRPFITF